MTCIPTAHQANCPIRSAKGARKSIANFAGMLDLTAVCIPRSLRIAPPSLRERDYLPINQLN